MQEAQVTTTQASRSAGNAEASIANTVHLAERINRLHATAVKHSRRALENARAAGELLLEAKDGVKHGEWRSWLNQHFAGSERTAQRYMRVAKRWQKIVEAAKNDSVSDVSLCEALELARYGYSYKFDSRRTMEGQA